MPLRPPAGFISANYDPLKNPDAPTGVSASAGDASASVSFTAPANVGGSAITAYYAVSNPGQITSSGASSPVTVTGLSNGTSYTFTVWALNSFGPGPFSAASGSVTPTNVLPSPTAIAGGAYANTNRFNISTLGNAVSFPQLTVTRFDLAAFSSTSRAIFACGNSGGATNVIDYITYFSDATFADFGDATAAAAGTSGCSNNTRGCFALGYTSDFSNVINYVTIATTGNATSFGNLTVARYASGSCASTTRGVWAGGYSSGFVAENAIDYITIASTGNATDFGDLTVARAYLAGLSNATRGCFAGLYLTGNVIDYITIASTGNASDFGDLLDNSWGMGGAASSTRGCYIGGAGPSNVIQYITIASTGNAQDFGDLTIGMGRIAACSNGHGGL